MNASYLAYTVISQEINPDAVIIYGARLAVANMRTAHSVWGVPEVGIMGACAVQLARYYGLLSDVYGYSSSSCTLDSQWGYECCLNGILPFLSGANILSGFGSFGSGFITSYESLILDNEVFGMNLRASQGIVVDDDHLAVDVIAEAMNGKDYFLQQHTLKHLRTGELYQPTVGLYGLIKQWEDDGAPDVRQKAREKVLQLLDSYEDMPFPDEAERELDRIMKAAEKELV